MQRFKNRNPAKWDGECGLLSVEAMFSIMVFMIFMFAMYSFTILFMAQNMIGHALMEAGQSLSLETYGISKLNDDKFQVADIAVSLVQLVTDNPGGGTKGEGDFYTHDQWYKDADKTKAIVERRFKAFLGGSPDRADEILDALRVSSITFENSKVVGNDLTIEVSYDISLLIRFKFGSVDIGKYHSTQSVVSRLWGSL